MNSAPCSALPSSTPAPSLIDLAYDPALFQAAGETLVNQLTQHLARTQAGEGPVLPWTDPRDNLAAARAQLAGDGLGRPAAVDSVESGARRFGELVKLALARGHNLHHPHYVGHQVPAAIPIAGLFDALGAVTNNPMAIYEMGPWATSAEQAMIGELGGYLGWKDPEGGGIVTHGASLANLTAMLVARNRLLEGSWEDGVRGVASAPSDKSPVIVTQADAHYCITRAGGILGLGTRQVLKVPLDSRRRMDVTRLDELLAELGRAGRPVIAVAASACATPIGAFDPLDQVAEVCRRYGVWMHVDAAHGGAALLSRKYRGVVQGISEADSVTWDAHKMLFVPALCAFLFYKRKSDSYEAFRQNAPYLFDPRAPELMDFDGGLRTVECTKRAMVLGLWGVWSLFGPALMEQLVDRTFDLARTFYEKLTEAPDFVALHEPQCNIVVFRHIPARLAAASNEVVGAFQDRLRRAVCQSGRFYLVPCVIDGVGALRCTLINPKTTPTDLDELLDTLREFGARDAAV